MVYAADLACAYAEAGASFLIATRLDVIRRLGGVLAAADAARLTLTEAGIGPGAADGLVPMTPDFLAEERETMGERWYRQEYACSFEDTIDAVFSHEDIMAAMSADVKPLFQG